LEIRLSSKIPSPSPLPGGERDRVRGDSSGVIRLNAVVLVSQDIRKKTVIFISPAGGSKPDTRI